MNSIDSFFSDYFNMPPLDFRNKYSQYSSYLPSKEDLLLYFQNNNKLKSLVNLKSDKKIDGRVFLIQEDKQYKVYTIFRDDRDSEKMYSGLKEAALEKMRRVIGELRGNRR
jgi:hypothetical protein